MGKEKIDVKKNKKKNWTKLQAIGETNYSQFQLAHAEMNVDDIFSMTDTVS